MQPDLFSTVKPSVPANHSKDSTESVVTPDVLNPAQYAAASHGPGPVLVIAGAGSGKTRTLVYRMAWLLEHGAAPESILLLTFTRRAAQEMLWRAGRLTDQSSRRVMGGTFHATANILLRQHGHHLGLGAGFTIIDRGDSEGIINLIKSSLGLGGKGQRFPSKRVILNLLSGAINKARTLEELVYEGHIHLSEFITDLYTIRSHYAQFKLDNGLMDYDDLLVNWRRLLLESHEARAEICHRFSNILVDEYQDTNPIQAEIVRLLAAEHGNVMVVGDDAQSIYSFRGADFHNIIRFPKEFSGASIIKLEENYRSTQPILELTNAIIDCAEEKFAKTLFTSNQGGARPVLFAARDEGAEARWIVDRINALQQDGTQLTEIAILFRSGYHSYKLEMELASRSLDYEKRGGLKLTESAHIKDILSFLRLLVNPWDSLSWNRLLLQLDKVGPKTAQKITARLSESDDPFQTLSQQRPGPAWKEGYRQLIDLFCRMRKENLTPSAVFDLLMEYYQPLFEKIYFDDHPKRRKDIDQIKVLISGYDDLQSLVDDTALDPPDQGSENQQIDEEQLVLSTIHSAKGLEWDTVFVIGLAEGRFPHQNAVPGEQYEEERRLLYVAATRARKQLYLTFPRALMTPDRQHRRATLSPFLREIDPTLYHQKEAPASTNNLYHAPEPYGTPSIATRKQQSAKASGNEYAVGMTVRHPFFGQGTIKSIPGPRRVEVAFDRHGIKILHLDYARLESND